jgi:uncharacterized membrane protein YjjP (DUF1212 family)
MGRDVALGRPPVTAGERSDLVLAFARTLYVNGQATEDTVRAVERLSRAVGLRAMLVVRWGELKLVADDGHGSLIAVAQADPAGVEMDRVASTMRAIDDIACGRLSPDVAMKTIGAIMRAPPAPTWLFAFAAAAGAVALAVIFGAQHSAAAALIFLSAGTAGLLRRALAQFSSNLFLQPFCAALLAGVAGAVAAFIVASPRFSIAISSESGRAARYYCVTKFGASSV